MIEPDWKSIECKPIIWYKYEAAHCMYICEYLLHCAIDNKANWLLHETKQLSRHALLAHTICVIKIVHSTHTTKFTSAANRHGWNHLFAFYRRLNHICIFILAVCLLACLELCKQARDDMKKIKPEWMENENKRWSHERERERVQHQATADVYTCWKTMDVKNRIYVFCHFVCYFVDFAISKTTEIKFKKRRRRRREERKYLLDE